MKIGENLKHLESLNLHSCTVSLVIVVIVVVISLGNAFISIVNVVIGIIEKM